MTNSPEPASRWIPALLVVLGALTVAMMALALGVMFDVLPTWTRRLGSAGGGTLVAPNRVLPVLSSIVGVTFVVTIFRRWAKKGGTHLLVWGIGLAFFATGSLTEAIHGLFGWHDIVFRFWYLFGAVLIAAWMGQGTVHLLAPKAFARVTLVLLIAGSVWATYRVFTAQLDPTLIARGVRAVHVTDGFDETEIVVATAALLRETALDDDGAVDRRRLTPLARGLAEAAAARGEDLPAAELAFVRGGWNVVGTVGTEPSPETGRPGAVQTIVGNDAWLAENGIDVSELPPPTGGLELAVSRWGWGAARIELEEAIVFSGHVITTPGVRSLTPFFNTFGIIWLIGGAIWSAWIFWRRRIMRNRAVGNILIAAGAILGGGGSAFARFGMLNYLYLAELSSLILVFAGFIVATRPSAADVGG